MAWASVNTILSYFFKLKNAWSETISGKGLPSNCEATFYSFWCLWLIFITLITKLNCKYLSQNINTSYYLLELQEFTLSGSLIFHQRWAAFSGKRKPNRTFTLPWFHLIFQTWPKTIVNLVYMKNKTWSLTILKSKQMAWLVKLNI